MTEAKKTFTIGDSSEVFYPEVEKEDLTRCLTLTGFQNELRKHTGIAPATVVRIEKDGKGLKRVVDAVREFVKIYLKTMEEPLKSAS